MSNEPNQRDWPISLSAYQRVWIIHSLGRLEGEVKQLSERMASVEKRLDQLLYALLVIGGMIGVGVLLSLFGVRFGG